MEYVYDIILNFQEAYYDFYEWQRSDKIINLKKVPIYKINDHDYLNIKYHQVSIDTATLPKPNKIFLITSGLEVMAILINNNGKVVKRSSLIFEEADDILKDKEMIKKISFKYQIEHKNKIVCQSRNNQEKMNYIDICFHNINKEKDEYFLKYLYYDIYHTELDDPEKIYQELISLSKKDISKMYASLKKINMELKKSFD